MELKGSIPRSLGYPIIPILSCINPVIIIIIIIIIIIKLKNGNLTKI